MRWNESKLIVKIERWENFRAEQEAQVMEMKELRFVGVTNGEFAACASDYFILVLTLPDLPNALFG